MEKLIIGGYVIGGLVCIGIGYLIGKKKYQEIEESAVASVKKAFKDKCEYCEYKSKKNVEDSKNTVAPDKVDVNDMDKQSAQKIEYNKLVEKYKIKEEGDGDMDGSIYVISPDSFGDSGYKALSLTLYSNNVLVDDIKREVIKTPEKLVGKDYMNHFGNYDDPDRVCIRNDTKKLDIEILFDMDEYEE